MAYFKGKRYKPVTPQADDEKSAQWERLMLYHGNETRLEFIDSREIYAGWVVGIVDNPTFDGRDYKHSG